MSKAKVSISDAGTEKQFTVAGYSTLNGVRKIRFANDLVARIKRLDQCGHENIELEELPQPMTKGEVREWLAKRETAK